MSNLNKLRIRNISALDMKIFNGEQAAHNRSRAAKELLNLNNPSLAAIHALITTSDSVRSKYLEERLSMALTPFNHTGEGDVCDIWVSFKPDFQRFKMALDSNQFGIRKGLDTRAQLDYLCGSNEQGIGLEVKVTRTRQFTVKKTQGMAFLTPYSNRDLQEDVVLKIQTKYRWSDIYILIALNDSAGVPEDCITSIFLVPTFMFTESNREATHPLSDLITKSQQINIKKLSSIINPINVSQLDWSDPKSINTAIRTHIMILLAKYKKEMIAHRVTIENIKWKEFQDKSKAVEAGTSEFTRIKRASNKNYI